MEPPAEPVPVADVAEIPEGTAKVFLLGVRRVAVFNLDGRFVAIDAECPHRRGPLAEGLLAGNVVTCPWHGWEIDLTTGQVLHDPARRVACFDVRIQAERLYVTPTPLAR